MRKRMILTTVFLALGFAGLLPVCLLSQNAVAEALTVTVGVTLYHFAMRLAVGTIVDLVMKNQADHTNGWFREKSFEDKLYKLIRVRRWKKYVPTYDPETFDPHRKTVRELIGATCQAEIIHEVIMVLSLLPIAFAPLLGGTAAMITTSVCAMLIDSVFVILQRYNRPRLVRVMKRFDKL